MRALITGVGGFAGPHLVAALQAAGCEALYGLCRHPTPASGYVAITADLLDRATVARVVAEVQPTHVYHLAAQSHVPTSYEDAGATLTNNLVGQVNLLDACRALPTMPRVLVVGSAEEYGLARPDEMPLREDQPFRPTSPYAVSKVAQDLLGWQYYSSYGLPVVRVRAFNHTGPGQSDRFVVSAFARQIAEAEAGLREPVLRTGNLDTQRDFLDVRDVVHAYVLALNRGEPGAVYNVGSGTGVRIGAILDMLRALARVPVRARLDTGSLRPSDVPILIADASALRAATGWRQEIPFEQSLRDTLDWWRERVDRPTPPAGQPPRAAGC